MHHNKQYQAVRFLLVAILLMQIIFTTDMTNSILYAQNEPSLPDKNSEKLPQTSLYYKSQMGLMDEAYGIGENRNQSGFTSGSLLDMVTVYESGSWPETVIQGQWSGNSAGEASLATSFDFDPPNDNRLHLYTQTGTGTLIRTQQVATDSVPMAMAKGDLNHDGLDDVAVVNQADDTLGVFLQLPGGGLGNMTTYATGTSPDGLALGDFNSDTRLDVAVSHAVDQTIAIYYQQSDGTLSTPTTIGVSSGGFNELEAGDVNGDGYDDLVMLRGAGHTSLHLAIFYQQDYALLPPIFRTAQDGGFLAHGLAVGDVTDDGRADIIVTAGGNIPNAFVNVFVQQPDGSLATSPTVYPAFHLPEAVEVGDVNHDGRNDVILSHAAWMSLSVYTQTVTSTLSAYESYPLPYTDYYRPDGLALGDVSNDGGLDVLLASHSDIAAENGLVVLTNTGTAPTSTITTPSTSIFITNTNTLLFGGTASANAVTLEISTDGGQTWQSQSATVHWSYNWNVPEADGRYPILVRTIDTAGRFQSPPAQTYVIVDRTPPTGTLLINEAATYTNNPDVILTISGSDFHTLLTMQFANQGESYSSWYNFVPTHTWTLSNGDGLKTVLGQVRDMSGNISEPFSDTIILDTTPPTCSVLINNGAAYTNSTQATLALGSTDTNGVDQMRIRNAGSSWSAWQSYATTLSWNLGIGNDGSRTVEAQFLDIVGNESAVCNATIILDRTPPSCSVVANNGDVYTNQTNITLTLSSTDNYGVSEMHFSNDGTTWSSWASYATTDSWNLAALDGSKVTYARFRDVANNVSDICQDNIILDTMPPTGFVIVDGGASHTTVPDVALTLGASDTNGVTTMRFSNDGSTWSNWDSYTATAQWVLSTGDGSKTVYVQFQDAATNIGGPFTDSIILDATPPAGSVSINNGATYTNIPTTTLTIAASDATAVANMRLSHDSIDWLEWEPYTTSRSWALTGSDGTKTVYIQFQDTLGNISDAFGDAIVLDTAPPNCQLFINNGAAYTTQFDVGLQVTCSDPNTPIQVRYSNDGTNWSEWEGYTAVKNWTLISNDGLQTIYLQAQDTPGNISEAVTDTITLDTIAPSCNLLINNGVPYATSLDVALAINCLDSNGLNELRLSDNGIDWEAWQPYTTALPWTLIGGQGEKVVYLQASDMPGNISTPITATITLDTVLPSGGCTVESDTSYVNNVNVNLTLWNYDDNGVPDMQIRNQGESWGEWIPSAGSTSWALPDGDGNKQVECRFRDSAGNVSITYSDQIILDTQPSTCDININGGVEYVNDQLVTLVLESIDDNGLNGMRFSHDAVSWTTWETYAASRSWTLQAGDGQKTVWAQFRDLAGNVTQCNDNALLDTTPPSGTIVLNNGADYTMVVTATVTLTVTDDLSGIDQVCLSEDEGTCSNWQPFVSSTTWYFDPGEQGTKQLCTSFQDFAGNQSEAICDTVILDTIAPTGDILINNGSAQTSTSEVMLTLSAQDENSGVCDMQIRNNGNNWANWQPYTQTTVWLLEAGAGTRFVEARFRDCAGNVSEEVATSIVLGHFVYLPTIIR